MYVFEQTAVYFIFSGSRNALMIAQNLKDLTRTNHASLEKKLLTHIKAIRSVNDYVNLLRLMYGFYEAAEQKLSPRLTAMPLPYSEQRRKAGNILNDIAVFDDTITKFALCANTPDINSEADVLGALYVLEGSTLGGRIIAGIISKQLNIPVEQGFSFFNCYGSDAETMWSSFKTYLDQPAHQTFQNEILLTANETFLTFYNWIDQHANN